jgi:hypothetical protein
MTTTSKESRTWKFWAYTGVLSGLSLSLAANITAAGVIHKHPTPVDYGIAGFAPAAMFMALQILALAPWSQEHEKNARRGLITVAISAGVTSYIHLVLLVVKDPGSGRISRDAITWVLAVLAPWMIDGLLVVGAAALLLNKTVPEPKTVPVPAPQRAETKVEVPAPVVQAAPAPAPVQKAITARGNDPVFARWLADGKTWDLERVMKELDETGRNGEKRAAREVLRRWNLNALKMENA